MNEQSIYQIDQILLSFTTIDAIKINEVISYDPSKQLLTELINIFDFEIKDKIEMIRKEYSLNQYTQISSLAHRIRSTSLNLGAIRLSEILKRIEYMTLESEIIPSEIDFLINSVEKEYQLASKKLRSYITEQN